MKISVSALEKFAETAFLKTGMSQVEAHTAAQVLASTDSWGVFTHGTKNLPDYVRRLQGGGLRSQGVPRMEREGAAWGMVDGDSSLGMVTSVFAMEQVLAKAKTAGLAYVGVRNSCHFGAAGYYASLALRKNCIGLAFCNDTPTVAAPGSTEAVLGSNPIAIAVPAGREKPMLLDMATSTVAGGKVFAAAMRGEKIPEGWIIDQSGKPTTDPRLFPHAASLTPVGGHKGYGLALAIEVLSAVLPGAAIAGSVLSWSFHDLSQATGHGAAFMAIDVGQMTDLDSFKGRMDRLIQEIHAAPTAEGAPPLLIPGEMEWAKRELALLHGIDLPETVAEKLRALAKEMGILL